MKTLILIFGMLLVTLATSGQYAEVVLCDEPFGIGKKRFLIDIVYADSIVAFTDTIYNVLELERLKLQPKVIKALNFMEQNGWAFVFEYMPSDFRGVKGEHYLFRKKE